MISAAPEETRAAGGPGPLPARTAPTPGPIPTRWVRHGLSLAARTLDAAVAAAPADLEEHQTSLSKIAAETAILLRVAASVGDAAVDDAVRSLAGRLLPIVTSPRVRLGIALRPAAALDQGAAYLVLREAHPDAAMDAALGRALGGRSVRATERVPHRALEQAWLQALLDPRRSPDDAAIRRTVLGARLDVLTGTRDDAYALTHALMYATDFGRHPQAVPADLHAGILAGARAALAGTLDDEDWDLAGELLLAWPLLGVDAGAAESAALRVVLDVAEAVGTLPSATLATTPVDARSEPARSAALMLAGYHTAYVFAILAALAPRCRWTDAVAGGPALRDVWPDDESGRPAWLDLPFAAAAGSALAGASLARDAARRRHVRARRFADLAADVTVRPLDGEAARQSLELLERLAALASA